MPAVSNMDLWSEGILGEFEGSPITATGVEIRNAAGGLNESLKVDPMVKHQGDTVYVLLRCDVTGVNFKPVKDEEGEVMRVHVMRATDVTLADGPDMVDLIDRQRARIQKSRDDAKGQFTFGEDERL
jgi:hypothetical protein